MWGSIVDQKKTAVRSSRIDNDESFINVFQKCYEGLKSVVYGYVKHPHDVEDIVQETFVRVYQANKQSRISNLKAYLFTTARNLSFKHLSLHANKITDYLDDLALSEVMDSNTGITLEQELQAHEQFCIFCEALRELPLQCRRAFILKKVYGLNYDEISERLNITPNTVNQHITKGMARCTQYMREKGYLGQLKCGKKHKRAMR